jgi:hypothetical protein
LDRDIRFEIQDLGVGLEFFNLEVQDLGFRV